MRQLGLRSLHYMACFPYLGTVPGTRPRLPRYMTLLVLIGVALRVWSYAAVPTFWLDEVLLARNIVALPLGELLTGPLYLDQVAPRGFLLVEKLAAGLFGPGELGLRLFPLLCAVAGVVLFRRLAERTLEGWAPPFALALYALGVPFIRYAAEVKQYQTDALAAVLLLLLVLDLRVPVPSTRRLLLAGLVGLVLPWFSQASVLVMAGMGAALAAEWMVTRDRSIARVLLVTMPMWAAAALLAVVVGRQSMTPSTRAFMQDFWASGFFPLPLRSAGDLRWVLDQSLSIFSDAGLLRYRWPGLFLVVAIVGCLALWRERREVVLLLLGPIALALVAAVAQQYPFRGRLIFYLVPGVLLAVAAGAERIRRAAARLHPLAGAAAMLLLLAQPVLALVRTPPPYDIEHHRTMLGYLAAHRRPGDVVHVFPLTRIGVMYYGPRFGIQPGDWVTAVCDRTDTRAYLRDVDRHRGRARVWVLSSDVRPFRTARPALRRYLSTIGTRLDSLSRPSLQFGAVSLELYDLSDSARLASASADTFPVLPMPTDPRPGCRPWSQPSPLDSFP